jgi:murein DD-endopeptidase MepM/ murein hydrolase activator NlpD
MQIMWLSGPTSQVKKISITARNVLRAALALALGLMILGFILNWVGLRIAVEYNPDLARKLGGVTTELEQKRMESVYRERLDQLKDVLEQNIQDVKKLEAMKNRFMELATPAALKNNLGAKDDSRGGPYISPPLQSYFKLGFIRQPLQTEFQQASQQATSVKEFLASHEKKWKDHLEWLQALPIGMPIHSDFRFTSGFGVRNDPFTGALAMHEGLDFAAEVGTKVMAAGPGVVVRSNWDPGYGHVVEIQHAENFLTRYAHLSKRSVGENMQVATGMVIGDVGNTGRSTGPHLHYEIYYQGKAINPLHVLPVKAP